MSLLPFLIVTIGGALATLLVPWGRRTTVVGGGVLVAAVVTAILITPGEVLVFGGSGIATTAYLRLFLILASTVGLLLAFVGAATGGHRHVPAVTAAVLATSALALSLPDPRLAVLAATAGGAFGALLTVTSIGARAGATVGIRIIRVTVIAGTLAVAAMAWTGRDLSELAAQPIVFGLTYLAVALAVALRFGAIPFHAWAARSTDAIPETALPLVTAMAPAAFAVVALGWMDASIAPLPVDLDTMRAVVVAIAAASILLASVAAWIQDDIEHIVGYSIVGDAGVVLLAVAALDPEAWAPARTWILAFIVVRSAFAAWAAALRMTFLTGRVADLRGWAIRSPLLSAVFALVVLASIGLPGLAAFEARATLVSLALDGPLAVVVLLGTFTPLAYYGRLLFIGVERPDAPIGARTWRPNLPGLDLTDVRGSLRRAWTMDRGASASAGALVLAVLGLLVSAGAIGGPEAAAGLPPTIDGAAESFSPDGPTGSEAPELEPEPEPEPASGEPASDEPAVEPSLEAAPTP